MSKKISFEDAYAQAVTEGIKIFGTRYFENLYYIKTRNLTVFPGTADKPSALDEALEHAIDGRNNRKLAINPFSYCKIGINEEFTS